jgi:hypothetical protein
MQSDIIKKLIIAAIAFFSATAFAANVQVPFVGCPADGQVGPLAPPVGKARIIRIEDSLPGLIAYYKGAQGYGVFAPAGWHCRETYGSSGAQLVVAPHKFLTADTISYPPPLIEMSTLDGQTSGRFMVAELGSMLFQSLTKQYVSDIEREGVLPLAESRADLERKKYPTDKLTYYKQHGSEIRDARQ